MTEDSTGSPLVAEMSPKPHVDSVVVTKQIAMMYYSLKLNSSTPWPPIHESSKLIISRPLQSITQVQVKICRLMKVERVNQAMSSALSICLISNTVLDWPQYSRMSVIWASISKSLLQRGILKQEQQQLLSSIKFEKAIGPKPIKISSQNLKDILVMTTAQSLCSSLPLGLQQPTNRSRNLSSMNTMSNTRSICQSLGLSMVL